MAALQPSTLQFLNHLAANNFRPWFQENKPRYEAALSDMKSLMEDIRSGMEKKDHIESMKLMRIYRDVRFSKNKDPYKNNFGMGIKRATAALRGGYYLHIQPGESFAGGGFWAPESNDLKRIRKEFEMDDESIRKITNSSTFKNFFGTLEGDELKTAPKGFDKDHPAIDLIRKKQFVVRRRFSDQEVTSPNFSEEVVKTFHAMRPFFDYMSDVLTTNLNGESVIE
jgi:uncharacterized protein (TIGR02453 family)